MLTVHHLGISQSDRIVWLCEELAIPYGLVRYERDPVTRLAPANYKALHPTGTAPVVTDDGLTLGESGAIIDYIVAKHGGGRLTLSADHPDFARYFYWYHFAGSSLMPSMMGLTAFPHLRTNVRRVVDRPAFQAAKAKADPDLVLRLD